MATCKCVSCGKSYECITGTYTGYCLECAEKEGYFEES